MLTNLLSNALKFTSKEKQAKIEFGEKTVDNTMYYFIKDNGVGFDPEYSEKLFKAFDRLHSQKEFKGTGIGLATVKRIVNLHGGTIWAEGEPGEGATFYFNFNGVK
jgi:light-regulated signal transduction histidine kinase (bacteriophytochrome)